MTGIEIGVKIKFGMSTCGVWNGYYIITFLMVVFFVYLFIFFQMCILTEID